MGSNTGLNAYSREQLYFLLQNARVLIYPGLDGTPELGEILDRHTGQLREGFIN